MKTLRPPLAGLIVASALIAGYRILAFGLAGSHAWGFLVVASALLWTMCVVLVSVVLMARLTPLYDVVSKRRASQALAVVLIPAGAGVLSTRGLSARLVLGLSAGIVSAAVAAFFRRLASHEQRGRRRVALLLDTLLVSLLIPFVVSSGEPADLNGLTTLNPGNPLLPERSIVLVGVDGLDWMLFEALAATDRLPNLQALKASGVAGPLHSIQPTSSPYIWNSIYTGFSPAVHRRRPLHYAVSGSTLVSGFYTDYPDVVDLTLGHRTDAVRYPRAVWDVFGALGHETAVVSAWERLPVPHTGRVFISREFEFDPRGDVESPPAVDPALVWTEGHLEETLAEALVPPRAIAWKEWTDVLGDGVGPSEVFSAGFYENDTERARESRLASLRAIYASDRFRFHMARSMIAELNSPFFLFVYFRGVDVVQHSYAHQLRGSKQPGEPDDAVGSYYEVVDEWIGQLTAELGRDSFFILVSDHGIDLNVTPPGQAYKSGWHPYAPHGVFLAVGPGISPQVPLGAHVFDVAPTLLALAGVPNLAAVEGRVIDEVAEPTILVEDWFRLEPTLYEMGNPILADPALRRELRALGYVR